MQLRTRAYRDEAGRLSVYLLGRQLGTYLSITRLTTTDTTPDITGYYSLRDNNPPDTISVTVDGQGPFLATVNPGGTWTLSGAVLTPLPPGSSVVTAVGTWPDAYEETAVSSCYVMASMFLIDELGNYLIDELGNRLTSEMA